MAATFDFNPANQGWPIPPPGSQALPVPSFVQVPNLPAIPPSFSSGAATPATPNNDVGSQNNSFFPAQDWLVTQSGNYQTTNNLPSLQNFVVNTVTASGSGATAVYTITLLAAGVAAVLEQFGVDLTGLFAKFLNIAGQPTRPISQWSTFAITIPQQDSFGSVLSSPAPGTTVQIPIIRQGPQDTFDTNNRPDLNVTIAPSPPVATTVPASGVNFLGNISATDGVVVPFVGSGQRLPPFIGTFEVEDQIPLGRGLPANVFV